MSLTIENEETDKVFTLIWRWRSLTGFADRTLPNPNGLKHEHPTEVVQGVIEFRFREKTIVVKAGETVVLPLGEPYDVIGVEGPFEVRCHYPKDVPGAAEAVAHLRVAEETELLSFPVSAAKPKSDNVEDWEGKPIPKGDTPVDAGVAVDA